MGLQRSLDGYGCCVRGQDKGDHPVGIAGVAVVAAAARPFSQQPVDQGKVDSVSRTLILRRWGVLAAAERGVGKRSFEGAGKLCPD